MKANILIGMLVVVSANVASAQSEGTYAGPQRPIHSPPLVMRHASTYEEGVLRGWADVGRALGERNYNNSLAAINYQEAVRRRLENHKQFVQDYFQKKEINREARFGNQVSRPTQEDLVRLNKKHLPDRLASHEYHRSLGQLAWPAVLHGDEFAAERVAIDRAIASRTVDNSGLGTASHVQIKKLTGQLEAKLKSQVSRLSSAESIAARKFLKSLAYEARFPLSVDLGGLAAR